MTKIAQLPTFTAEQQAELRDIFARFELILNLLRDFQKGLYEMDACGAVPLISVLRLFQEAWQQNSLLFDRFFPSFDFRIEDVLSQLSSAADVFMASECAVSAGLLKVAPGSTSYAFLLQCVCLHCRTLLTDARSKLKKRGVLAG